MKKKKKKKTRKNIHSREHGQNLKVLGTTVCLSCHLVSPSSRNGSLEMYSMVETIFRCNFAYV